jgi:hypothetical protein
MPEYRKRKMIPALLIIFGVVLAAALNVKPILISAIAGSILMILTGYLDLEDVYKAVEWRVIFIPNLNRDATANRLAMPSMPSPLVEWTLFGFFFQILRPLS